MFYIMSAIIFLAFGTSEVQDWNEPDANRTKGNAKKLDFDESGHIGDTEIWNPKNFRTKTMATFICIVVKRWRMLTIISEFTIVAITKRERLK